IGKSLVLKFAQRSDLYWIPESRNLPLSVVGVVGDVSKEGLPGIHPGEIYLPYKQNSSRFMHLILRAPGDPLNLASAVSDQIRSLDGDEALFDVGTMDDVMSRAFSQSRISSLLFGSFAILALVIASLGVYGIVSYTITRQRGEIGIRIALGAARRDI